MTLKYVQSPTLYLAGAGVIVGATTVTLTSLTDIYGNVLTLTDFGTKGYITLEPDTTNEEGATFTSVTANANGTYTLGGISTILARSAYTETSGLIRSHAGGTKVVITDNVAFWNTFPNKNNIEVISANWSVPDPVNNTDIANKEYVLSVVSGGTVTSNAEIVTGIAGATIAKGNLLYLDSSVGTWKVATSATASTLNNVTLGLAQGVGVIGNPISGGVLIKGLDISSQTSLTPNVIYYAGVSGAIATTAGATVLTLGVSQSSTSILFDPRYTTTLTEIEKAGLVGLSVLGVGGDGSDGAVTINTGTTTLTRDMFYTSLTVNGTGTLVTAGYKIWCQGSVTVDSTSGGGIQNKGGNGTAGATGDAGGGAGTGGAAAPAGTLPGGTAGGNGGQGGSNTTGTAGTAGTAKTLLLNINAGAAGGAGGASTLSQAGGAAGAAGAATSAAINKPHSLALMNMLYDFTSSTTIQQHNVDAGSGGGGGSASDNTGTRGGGGGGAGGGGGIVWISCVNLVLTGAGCISTAGGNGGAGGNKGVASTSAGGSGGGGGGNGGAVLVAYRQKTGTGTLIATAGTGGIAGTSGGGTAGTAGSNGSDGIVYQISL